MSIEQNKSVALKFLNALGNGQFDIVDQMLDEKATWWMIGTTPASGTHSRQAYIDMCKGAWELADGGFNMSFSDVVAEGDQVVVEGFGDRKLKTGGVYKNIYIMKLTVRDGKIMQGKEYFDTQSVIDLFKQLDGRLVIEPGKH